MTLTTDNIRPHTTFAKNSDGTVTAFFTRGDESALATGRTEEQALHFVLVKLQGAKTIGERPWLQLCTPCNKRMHTAECEKPDANEVTIELCKPCAEKFDAWKEAYDRWLADQKRIDKNKSKRERRARR